MNGEELGPLAQRSFVLEDRTQDRLLEVRARVETERRRRRAAMAAVAVASVLLVLLVSVAVAGGRPDGSTPDPAPSPAPNAATSRPEEGTCWAVPGESIVDQDYWYDDSPQVACDRRHTSETAAVISIVDMEDPDARDRAVDICYDYVRIYLAVDTRNWVPWGAAVLLPSREQVAAGASWARCDVVFPATFDFARAQVVTGSARGIATDPPTDRWACFAEPPSSTRQPLVPCDRPHRYEETGRVAQIAGVSEYPTARERRIAEVQCESGVPDRLSGYAIDARWDPLSSFDSPFPTGSDVGGICYVHDPSGGLLPALRGPARTDS